MSKTDTDSSGSAMGCFGLICAVGLWVGVMKLLTWTNSETRVPQQERIHFATPPSYDECEDIAKACASRLIASGETEVVKVDAGRLYTQIAEVAGHDTIIWLPIVDEDAFHDWYRTTPKKDRFVENLAQARRQSSMATLVVRAPHNDLDVEWVTFQVDPSSIAAVPAELPSQDSGATLSKSTPIQDGNQPTVGTSREQDQLIAAGVALTTYLFGTFIDQQLHGNPDKVPVSGYYRNDGTWVRPHERSYPKD